MDFPLVNILISYSSIFLSDWICIIFYSKAYVNATGLLFQIGIQSLEGDTFRIAGPAVLPPAITHLAIVILFNLMKLTLETRFD
jgi:hypothetical protein